jgi:hypothetical protein
MDPVEMFPPGQKTKRDFVTRTQTKLGKNRLGWEKDHGTWKVQ